MKIGYFGDGPWAHKALSRLLADDAVTVAFVCARYETPDPVLRDIASQYEIRFLTHKNVNSDEFMADMFSSGCDLFVSMSFNQIFRRPLIQCPPRGTINCHAGKLPFYRGRNVLNWALINGEPDFGITVHYVDEGIDTGDIILQKTFPIHDDDDYSTLLLKAYDGCADLLHQAVTEIRLGSVTVTPQESIHPLGFYCTARKEGDERLSWNQSSKDVFNFVRALCRPGPEARSMVRDAEIRINKVVLLRNAPCYKGIPGAVLAVDGRGFLVKTLDSFVRVVDWSSDARVRVGDRLT